MAEANMLRRSLPEPLKGLGAALMLGLLGAAATSGCGGESKSDLNDDVVTGGKASGTGGASSGGAGTGGRVSGGASTGGTRANGGTIGSFGGSFVVGGSGGTGAATTGGAPAGGTATAGAPAGGAKATGGAAPSGGSDTGGSSSTMGGRASMQGGRASMMGGRDGSGGGGELPDDSCLETCELSTPGNPMCDDQFTWVCFGGPAQIFNTPECTALPTQVPRFCCSAAFRPCE